MNTPETPRKKKKKKRPAPTPPKPSPILSALKAIGRGGVFIYRQIVSGLEALIMRLMPSSTKRFVFVGGLFALILLLALGKIILFMFSPQATNARQAGAVINRPKEISIDPIRGTIYSSDGRAVAVTAPVYRLHFDFNADAIAFLHQQPKDEKEKHYRDSVSAQLSADLDRFAELLVSLYADQGVILNKDQIRERWRKGYRDKKRYVPVVDLDISYQHYRVLVSSEPYLRIDTLKKGIERRPGLLSKIITPPKMRSKRFYPFGSLAHRTIGNVYGEQEGGLSQGKNGIEKGLDTLLRGKNGRGLSVAAAKSTNNVVVEPAIDGYSVYTTLDMDIQNQLERIMRKQLGQLKAASGTAILLDVATAKVLAIANLARNSAGDGYTEAQNFAVSDLSEPGSTFKVASMLVALDAGMVRPDDIIDVGNGTLSVGGRTVRDHNAGNGGYGEITASQVIERSSNVGVAKIILQNFASRPSEYVKRVRALGFGDDLTLREIPGGARAEIRMPNQSNWYGTTLAWMSYGYETQIPPLYTAAFFNAIANGGKLLRPYIVSHVTDKDGRMVQEYKPTVVRERIAKPESIQAMQSILQKVVTDGTGKRVRSKVVAVSGKSGTAQLALGGSYHGPDGKRHQVSFCGFFPSESPRYTLMVVVRQPSPEFAAGGGSMAGPVVRELAEAIISMEKPASLDSIGLPSVETNRKHIAPGRKGELMQLMQAAQVVYKPNAKATQDSYVALDEHGREQPLPRYPEGVVPNVMGMTATDAGYMLAKYGYKVKLNGYGRVVAQSVASGTKLSKGASIALNLR